MGKPFEKGNQQGFHKGQSGNPGGKPSIVNALKANGINPTDLTAELVRECLTMIRDGDKRSASWRWCMQTLWDALGLKPVQVIEIAHREGLDFGTMSDAELDAIIAAAEPDAVH